MLDKFLKTLDQPQQNAVVQALAILEDFQLFDYILREELVVLANSVGDQDDPTKIHALIIGFKAKEAFVSQLKSEIPTGD